jgi:hypothetical protein
MLKPFSVDGFGDPLRLCEDQNNNRTYPEQT